MTTMSINFLMDFLSKFRLPLKRGEKNTFDFLIGHFQDFESDLTALLTKQKAKNTFEKDILKELREKQESVHNFSKAILDSLQAHRDGDALNAHRIFEGSMNKMQGRLISSSMNSDNGILNRFFRIREYKECEECSERKDLFHIPFEESQKAKFCRYSVAGSPHLYLSGALCDAGLLLAWLETDCPSKFCWSEFIFSNYRKEMELLDFTWSPFSNAMKAGNYRTWLISQKPFAKDLLINYISTYPLIASCSIEILNKNSQSEISEYIIPQMLLAWVGANGSYRGIKYYSCAHFNEARKLEAFNVVLPPQRDTLSQGYCPKLKCEFKVSKPELTEISDIHMLETKEINSSEFKFIDETCEKNND